MLSYTIFKMHVHSIITIIYSLAKCNSNSNMTFPIAFLQAIAESFMDDRIRKEGHGR